MLTPEGQQIGRMIVGLGWQSLPGHDVDLDAGLITFDAEGKRLDVVGRRNSGEYNGAISHRGDSRTGSVDGSDAEVIMVELPRLPAEVASMVFTINSFSGDRFTDIQNAYLRIADEATGRELARFDLTDTQPSTAVLMAIVRRSPAVGWELRAIGEFHDTRFARKLVDFAQRHALMP